VRVFTAEETQAGVDFIGKTAPGRYATADTVAEEAVGLSLEGLTTEFTTVNLRALADVDASALAAAYDRYVSGDWTVVLWGCQPVCRGSARPGPRRGHRPPRLIRPARKPRDRARKPGQNLGIVCLDSAQT